MKDFSLDFDPTTESYTDMSFDSILSQYKLESYQDASSGSGDSSYSPLYDDEDDDVRVYTPGAASSRKTQSLRARTAAMMTTPMKVTMHRTTAMTAPYHPALTITVRRTTVSPSPRFPVSII